MSKRGESREYSLTQVQITRVHASLTDRRDLLVFDGLVQGGLRISELTHLRPTWVKPSPFKSGGEMLLSIPLSMPCSCGECTKKRGGMWKVKSRAGSRSIYLPPHLMNLVLDPDVCKPLTGIGLSRVGAWHRVKKILKVSQIIVPGLAQGTAFPHALRATCATTLAANGASAAAICYHMGWANIQVGEHYVRIAEAQELAHKETKQVFG